MVLRTASLSLMMPLANDAIRLTLAFAVIPPVSQTMGRHDESFSGFEVARGLPYQLSRCIQLQIQVDTTARLSRAAISIAEGPWPAPRRP